MVKFVLIFYKMSGNYRIRLDIVSVEWSCFLIYLCILKIIFVIFICNLYICFVYVLKKCSFLEIKNYICKINLIRFWIFKFSRT